MFDENLIVDVDSLTTITIPSMQKLKTDIETSFSNMTTTINELVDNGYMDSETAIAYVNEFNSLLSPDIQALVDLVSTYATQLGQICENFIQNDKNMANNI